MEKEIMVQNNDLLVELVGKIGKIDSNVESIKEDIVELKDKDVRQTEALDKAYERAKNRQDSIRDDLQHQIDDIKNMLKDDKKNIETAIKDLGYEIKSVIQTTNETNKKSLEDLDKRITVVENAKKDLVYKWWQKIVDKIMIILIAIVFAAVFKYINFQPPKLP